MTTQVKIRNYQSLESVDLELSGFTVITGQSNVGKSAVVRAIASAIFGNLGDYFIKDKPFAAPQCAVMIADEQLSIKWWKVRDGQELPNRCSALEVNGRRFTKYGKGQAEIIKEYGFVELVVGGDRLRPQIASQHDSIFLLSGSETEAAEALKLLGRVDVVTDAQRMSAKDAKEQAQKLKIRQEDVVTAKAKVEESSWVKGAIQVFKQLKRDVSEHLTVAAGKGQQLEKIQGVRSLRPREVALPVGDVNRPVQMELLAKIRGLESIRMVNVPHAVDLVEGVGAVKRLSMVKEFCEADIDFLETVANKLGLEREIRDLYAEKIEMERELGKCPTCERDFDECTEV